MGFDHPVLELAILSTNMSVAPQAVSSSMTVAMFSFSTIELTATHAGSSRAVMVGARLPGVIFAAVSRPFRATLYWHRINFCAAKYGCELNDVRDEREGLTDDATYSGCNHVDESLVRRMF